VLESSFFSSSATNLGRLQTVAMPILDPTKYHIAYRGLRMHQIMTYEILGIVYILIKISTAIKRTHSLIHFATKVLQEQQQHCSRVGYL